MYPITRTKIILPRRRADLLSRSRLNKLFDDLVDYKLMVITAPAGYGKTSVLVDVAHQLDIPVCWYSVDNLDNDPHRFIAHFIASIAQQFPNFGQSASLLDGALFDATALDRLVTAIVNELYEHVHEHFALILDDYHLVNDDATIKYFMDQFIQHVDENCHIVVSSRRLVNIDVILLTARRQAIGFGLNELAFQSDEIQALVLQNYNLTLSETAAQTLAHKTEGWITGLLLSVQSDWKDKTEQLRLRQIAESVGLYDYLAQQVLNQQPVATQNFLLQTSLLGEFDADLCQAVLGPGDWPALIETAAQENLFVLRVGNKLRYHHLFQDFLQHQIKINQPQVRQHILKRLGQVFAAQNQWEKAHEVYFSQLADMPATAALIEQAGEAMICSGRLATLERWIAQLPPETWLAYPRLVAIYGFVKTTLGQIEEGLIHLNQAEEALNSAGDPFYLTQTLLWRSTAYRFKGYYQAALADADRAAEMCRQFNSINSLQGQVLRARGAALHYLGHLNETITCWEQALSFCLSLAQLQDAAILRLELGVAYLNIGQYSRAIDHCLRSLEYWQEVGNLTRQANLLNNLAVIYHSMGQYDIAKENLEQAISLAKQSGYTYVESMGLASLGDLFVDLEDAEAALAAYEQAYELAQKMNHGFLRFYTMLAKATLLRAAGDFAQTRAILKQVNDIVQQGGSNYEQGLYELEMGRLALDTQQWPEAITHLEKATRVINEKQRYEHIRALMFLAQAHCFNNQLPPAAQYLARAFEVAIKLEKKHLLVITGKQIKNALLALEPDVELGPQIRQLLKMIGDHEQSIPTLRRRLRKQATIVPVTPPRLQIQAFGQSRVVFGDTIITSTKWQNSDLMREYFFYLVTHPEGIRREDIGLVIGPDISPGKLKRQFKNTVYRLRQMFTKEVIIFDADEDRYYFNRQLDYDYDVEAFERQIARARSLNASPLQQIEAYRTAINLYKGAFLPDINGEWVLAERENLSGKYVNALLKLSEIHLKHGVYEQTIYYCNQIAAENPYLEQAYRLAMRAYAAMGDSAAVKAKFEQCRQVLYDEVNVPVSPQTKNLFQALLQA